MLVLASIGKISVIWFLMGNKIVVSIIATHYIILSNKTVMFSLAKNTNTKIV